MRRAGDNPNIRQARPSRAQPDGERRTANMDVLDEAATEEALRRLPDWERTGDAITKTFVHDSFHSAMLFAERITDLAEGAAEVARHHLWIDIRSDNIVTVAIPTQDANGLTRADVLLAHRIEGLVRDQMHPPGLAGLS